MNREYSLQMNADGMGREGIGSVAQWVLRTIAVSNLLNYDFYFEGFKNINHYQHENINPFIWDKNFNEFFNFDYFSNKNKNNIEFNITNASQIEQIFENNLIKIFNDKILIKLKNDLRFENNIFNKEKINIALHIRIFNSMDNDLWSAREYFSPSNEKAYYYSNIIKKIEDAFPERKLDFYIYSQGDLENFNIFKVSNDKNNMYLKINETTLSSLYHMINADIFVASNSSFSYIAHLLSNGISIFRDNFYHGLYPNAILTDINGNFNNSKLKGIFL